MPTTYNKPNKYDHTSRKVFDRGIDKLDRKLALLKDEIRVLESRLNARTQDIASVQELLADLEYFVRTRDNPSPDRP